MIAPIIPIASARAKRLAESDQPGIMSGRVRFGRVELRFSQPIESFNLTPAQARFWADALLTLADSATDEGA